MLNLIIDYGVMEMLLDDAVLLTNTNYDKFLSSSDRALRNAGRNRVRLRIEQLMAYRKLIGERIITLDGKEYRYVRE